MLGLRVGKTCRVNVTDLSDHSSYELSQIIAKDTPRNK